MCRPRESAARCSAAVSTSESFQWRDFRLSTLAILVILCTPATPRGCSRSFGVEASASRVYNAQVMMRLGGRGSHMQHCSESGLGLQLHTSWSCLGLVLVMSWSWNSAVLIMSRSRLVRSWRQQTGSTSGIVRWAGQQFQGTEPLGTDSKSATQSCFLEGCDHANGHIIPPVMKISRKT